MKATMVLDAMIISTTMVVASTLTAELPPAADPETTDTDWFDGYVLRMRQLAQEDTQGRNSFQSDRAAELLKYCSSPTNQPSCQLSEKASALLSAMKRPNDMPQENDPVVSENASIGRQLIEERVFPIWAGTNWIDSRHLVVNGFTPSDEVQKQLAVLNYWEQIVGVHVDPKRAELLFSGRHIGNINRLRLTIMDAGFQVKFDKTFDIWRITGTNAPAVRSQ